MGELVVDPLFYDGDRSSEPVEGIFCSPNEADHTTLKYYTVNLVPDQIFHENEIAYDMAGGLQIRNIHPLESMFGLALANGMRNFYVKPGSVVLYLAKDDSSVVTISHLSDIVGQGGIIFVAAASKQDGDRFDGLCTLRPNVRYLVGANTTNPDQCRECLLAAFSGQGQVRPVDVLYCDVARPNQVECLSTHASLILNSGAHFVAFFKAGRMVYANNRDAVVPHDTIFGNEMQMLEYCNFQRVEAKSLGVLAPDWLCVVGSFNA